VFALWALQLYQSFISTRMVHLWYLIAPFNPNTLNSATFIMTVLTAVTTFVVNYRGRPFMHDLRGNKIMTKGLQIYYVALFNCALEVSPLNDLMQLAPLPGDGENFYESLI